MLMHHATSPALDFLIGNVYAGKCELQPVYTKRVCAYHKLGSMSTITFISKLHVHFCGVDQV